MAETQKQPALVRRLTTVIELGLVGLIAFLLVRAAILFITPEAGWVISETTSAQPLLVQARKQYVRDPSFDPFHREQVAVEVDTVIGEDAPETKLNLKLFGLRAGEDGSAILKTPDGKQGVFRIDEEIIDGVSLKAVNPGYIVLSQEGMIERLTFERTGETSLMAIDPDLEKDLQARGYQTRAPKRVAAASNLSPQNFMSAVSLERVSENGNIKGYKIKPKLAGYDLSAIGLQSGDIITKIGNEDLRQGLPDLRALANNLNQSKSTTVSIIRGNKEMTIRVGL